MVVGSPVNCAIVGCQMSSMCWPVLHDARIRPGVVKCLPFKSRWNLAYTRFNHGADLSRSLIELMQDGSTIYVGLLLHLAVKSLVKRITHHYKDPHLSKDVLFFTLIAYRDSGFQMLNQFKAKIVLQDVNLKEAFRNRTRLMIPAALNAVQN